MVVVYAVRETSRATLDSARRRDETTPGTTTAGTVTRAERGCLIFLAVSLIVFSLIALGVVVTSVLR